MISIPVLTMDEITMYNVKGVALSDKSTELSPNSTFLLSSTERFIFQLFFLSDPQSGSLSPLSSTPAQEQAAVFSKKALKNNFTLPAPRS